jgi:hypothetical protein
LAATSVLFASAAMAVPRTTQPAQSTSNVATTLYAATTDDEITGVAVEATGGPPWHVTSIAATQGGRVMRLFGKFVYVVNTSAGSVQRCKRDGTLPQSFDVGAGSEPQDVNVVNDHAYVTRKNARLLRRIDLTTGAQTDVVDLGVLAAPGEALSVRTMERDGNHLFVQVVLGGGGSFSPGLAHGVLGVVDLTTESLIDIDPTQPGTQGVAQAGAPPRLKMQIVERTLFVSTTESFLDSRGGIEMVDLDGLASFGYALSEDQFGGDLGGFVMTSSCGGFFVFHTDIVPSTHLEPFTISGGAAPGPEMIVVLGDTVEVIGYDAYAKRIFLPTGFGLPSSGGPPGIYVFNSITNQPVGLTPINTGRKPHDVVVAK